VLYCCPCHGGLCSGVTGDRPFIGSASFLFNSNRALEAHIAEEVDEDNAKSLFPCLVEGNHSFIEVAQTTSAAIHHMRLFLVFAIFGEDLGYWVKPRSTTWFSRFLLEQYDDD
jgi:hypothetical protein